MARTIDELSLKITVDGTAQVKTATNNLEGLDTAAKKTQSTLNQTAAGIRNIGFQVQDFTVQVSNGTSAITALSQQLPQLLSNFGTLGVYLGIVAAAIPLAVAGFKLLGYDTKNLSDALKESNDSIQRFQNSSKENIASAQALGTSFNGLEQSAKRFYETREEIDRIKAFNDLGNAIIKAKTEFGFFNDEIIRRANQGKEGISAIFGEYANVEAIRLLEAQMLSFKTGLPLEQIRELGNRLRELDRNAPEKNLQIITETANWLKENAKDASQFGDILKTLIIPLFDINQQILEMNRNMKEAGDRAVRSALATASLAEKFLPDIGNAKRRYDQLSAARLESEMKVQSEISQLRERTDLTDAQKTLMLLAIRKNSSAELRQVEKDIANQQLEQYNSQLLSSETRRRQLAVEKEVIQLRDRGLFDAEFNLRYDEEILRNAYALEQELRNIDELRRKNLITAKAENLLRDEAIDKQALADRNAVLRRDASVRADIIKGELELVKKSIEEQSKRYQALGDIINGVYKEISQELQRRPDEMVGFSSLQKQIVQIEQAAKNAAQKAAEAYGKQFESDDVLSPEAVAQYTQGLDQIAQAYRRLADVQTQFATEQYNIQRSFEFGWRDALGKFAEDASNNANYARTIFSTFTRGFEDAFVRFVQTGKLSFKDLANNILADVTRMAANKLLLSLFGMGGGATGGSILSSIGSFFGGFFAKGGTLGAGRWGIAGESGPEIISGPANITPMTAAPTMVTYNIQAVDASSFRALVARDPEFIFNVTEQGRRSMPTRSRR